ncbi:MAG: hypothetical protein JXR76_16340 [Deltaproteobacteria bacterium]|nr:hypothetical protein [Deltaproteobacteria bacterium]
MKNPNPLDFAAKVVGNLFGFLGEMLLDFFIDRALPIIALALIIAGAVLAIGIVWLTLPISPLLIISATGWWFTRKREAIWCKALSSVLLPVAVGLFLLFICLLTLNILKRAVNADDIRAVELTLIEIKLSLKSWINYSWPVFIILLVALVALSRVMKRSRMVTRFFKYQKVVSWTVILLTTLTTFTFFSQYPIADWQMREHVQRVAQSNLNIYEYKLLLREEKNAVAELLAIRSIDQGWQGLTTGNKDALQLLFITVHQDAQNVPLGMTPGDEDGPLLSDEKEILGRRFRALKESGRLTLNRFGWARTSYTLDIRNDVSESFAVRHAADIASMPEIKKYTERFKPDDNIEVKIARQNLEANLVEHQPTNKREWKIQYDTTTAQGNLLAQQKVKTTRRQTETSEAMVALTNFFSKAITAFIPDIGELPAVFVKKLVSLYAQHIFKDAAARWIRSNHDASKPKTKDALSFESLLPDAAVTSRLLVLQHDSRQERLKHGGEFAAEIKRRVHSMTVEWAETIRERLNRRGPTTIEEEVWLRSREAKKRGLTFEQMEMAREKRRGRDGVQASKRYLKR